MSKAKQFWREFASGTNTLWLMGRFVYRLRYGEKTHTAFFRDGSAVEWSRATGELVGFKAAAVELIQEAVR